MEFSDPGVGPWTVVYELSSQEGGETIRLPVFTSERFAVLPYALDRQGLYELKVFVEDGVSFSSIQSAKVQVKEVSVVPVLFSLSRFVTGFLKAIMLNRSFVYGDACGGHCSFRPSKFRRC